jgi:hypothetical protein
VKFWITGGGLSACEGVYAVGAGESEEGREDM